MLSRPAAVDDVDISGSPHIERPRGHRYTSEGFNDEYCARVPPALDGVMKGHIFKERILLICYEGIYNNI